MNSAELAFQDFSKPLAVHLYASATAIGATLSQEDDAEHLRLITCTSQKLNPAERNYPTHEREVLALVYALKRWKHYLLGSKVLAYTDNVSLKLRRTMQAPSPRQVRWLAFLAQYDVEIRHIPGVTNTAADALSRLTVLDVEPVDWAHQYQADAWVPRNITATITCGIPCAGIADASGMTTG